MAYIKVPYPTMINAAEQVDDYISRWNKNMNAIDSVVSSVSTEWKGVDYQQVKNEWNEINSGGSTSDRMRTSLKSYANSIREAAKLYKEAQARAINRANTLCK